MRNSLNILPAILAKPLRPDSLMPPMLTLVSKDCSRWTSAALLAFVDNRSKSGIERALEPSKPMNWRRIGASVNVSLNRWPLQIFQIFEVFWTFDDFSTNLPPPPLPSTPSYSTTIWAALVDDSVNELVLSIEVSGAAIFLKP